MASQQQAFRIRWGKLALALVGVLALVAVPVTLIVAFFTSLSFLTPVLMLAVVGVSFVGLRSSAIRDRRRKAWERAAVGVESARQEQEDEGDSEAGENAEAEESAVAAEPEKEAQPVAESASAPVTEEAFDFDTAVPTRQETDVESDAEVAPDDSAEVAETEAPASSDTAADAPVVEKDETWSPREIPAPTYTMAEPVKRPLPDALAPAAELKAQEVTSIRKAEKDREAGVDEAKKLDLDAVLQRRRA